MGVSGARFVVPPLAVCSSAAVVVGVTSSPCLELSFIYIYVMLRVNGGGVKLVIILSSAGCNACFTLRHGLEACGHARQAPSAERGVWTGGRPLGCPDSGVCVIAWVGVSVSRFPFLVWKELREIGQTCEFLPVRILAKIVRVALRVLSARARSVPLRWPGLCRLVVGPARPPWVCLVLALSSPLLLCVLPRRWWSV